MATTRSALKLLNIYKGLPVSNDGLITALDASRIVVATTRYQIACMILTYDTYILMDAQNAVLRAQVVELEPALLEVALAGFHTAHHNIGHRSQVRVEPAEPMTAIVRIQNSVSTIQASVADLSAGGIGIWISRSYFHPRIFQKGASLDLSFSLPVLIQDAPRTTQPLPSPDNLAGRFNREKIRGLPGSTDPLPRTGRLNLPASIGAVHTFNPRGRLVSIHPEFQIDCYRLGVNLLLDEPSRGLLAQYISRRQSELIREINALDLALARSP